MAAKLLVVAISLLPLYCAILYLLSRKRSSFHYAFKAFLLGCISATPLLILHESHLLDAYALQFRIGVIATTCLIVGMEEVSKTVAEHCHKHVHKKSEEVVPILKWVSLGLGFAFIENVIYVAEAVEHGSIGVIALRLTFSALTHTTFTSFGGYLSFGVSESLLTHVRGLLGASASYSAFYLFHHFHVSFLVVPLVALIIVYLFVLHKKHRLVLATRGDPPYKPPEAIPDDS